MAVVKAKFTKERKDAKVFIRYIQGRPGKKGERVVRQLFGADGNLTREEANRLIDEAGKRLRFFHLIVSPDPILEDSRKDLGLMEMTRYTMQTLEVRLNQAVAWVAAQHDDHRPHRHVHIVAGVKGKLKVSDLQLLRQAATKASLLQRQQLDLDQTRDYRRGWGVRSPSVKTHATSRSAGRRTSHQGAASIPVPFGILAC